MALVVRPHQPRHGANGHRPWSVEPAMAQRDILPVHLPQYVWLGLLKRFRLSRRATIGAP